MISEHRIPLNGRVLPPRSLRILLALLAAMLLLFVDGAPARASVPGTGTNPPVALTVPQPTGVHGVGVIKSHLVDTSRQDPWKPERKRELMVSVHYPAVRATQYPLSPWMSPGVVPVFEHLMALPGYLAIPSGSVDWVGARSNSRVAAPLDTTATSPRVVLFSTAQGTTRELNTVLIEDLASRGYIVVSIDHTYESAAVEFPNGRVEIGLNHDRGPVTQKKSIDSRVADTKFVLNRLAAVSCTSGVLGSTALPAGLAAAINTTKVGMFGHVQGGYTTAETMHADSRIHAGINLDGVMAYGDGKGGNPYLPGQAAQHGLGERPMLLMGAGTHGTPGNHDHTSGSDQSWSDFWSVHHGWKRDLTLNETALDSYTDFSFFLPQINTRVPIAPSMIELFIGRIDPVLSMNTQRVYVRSFFDLALRNRQSDLLNGPSPQYPEIKFNY
ncbi:lipase [Streptomyces sp. NPDC056500]|uniref:alpha/beta hydrolase n=1 Tax=Streptomyces sp. NPDC056500 TaxID=3345840 RepID=UPI0036B49525